MHWLVRTAAAAATCFALTLPAAGIAQAETATAPAPATATARTCNYVVNGNNVAVRRAPDSHAHVIKRKNLHDRVTGPCVNYHNGRDWTQVYLGGGGTGWMASAYLVQR